MAGHDDRIAALEADVAALREQLHSARTDAGAARALAAGSDRDSAELAGEVRALRDVVRRDNGALRDDVLAVSREVEGLREEMRAGFAQLLERLDGRS